MSYSYGFRLLLFPAPLVSSQQHLPPSPLLSASSSVAATSSLNTSATNNISLQTEYIAYSNTSGEDQPSQAILFQPVYLAYLWLALIIGLPGNLLISAVYVTVKQKRTSDWFIFFLAVYDCAVCVFAVPLYLSIETGAWVATGSDVACKLEQFIIHASQLSSVSILGIIAVDRFLKICHPTKRSLNARQARSIGMWTPVFSGLVATPILVWKGNVQQRFCKVQDRYKNTPVVKTFVICTFIFFVCMFFVVTYCYAKVIIVVKQRARRHKENAMRRKHLMEIPDFLRAISNVEEEERVRRKSNRFKRKFSLFTFRSSRRLSVISPWVKGRLSLPNENSDPKESYEMNEIEKKATRESLTESKKLLDKALSSKSGLDKESLWGQDSASRKDARSSSVGRRSAESKHSGRRRLLAISGGDSKDCDEIPMSSNARMSKTSLGLDNLEDVVVKLDNLSQGRRKSNTLEVSSAYTQSWTEKHDALWSKQFDILNSNSDAFISPDITAAFDLTCDSSLLGSAANCDESRVSLTNGALYTSSQFSVDEVSNQVKDTERKSSFTLETRGSDIRMLENSFEKSFVDTLENHPEGLKTTGARIIKLPETTDDTACLSLDVSISADNEIRENLLFSKNGNTYSEQNAHAHDLLPEDMTCLTLIDGEKNSSIGNIYTDCHSSPTPVKNGSSLSAHDSTQESKSCDTERSNFLEREQEVADQDKGFNAKTKEKRSYFTFSLKGSDSVQKEKVKGKTPESKGFYTALKSVHSSIRGKKSKRPGCASKKERSETTDYLSPKRSSRRAWDKKIQSPKVEDLNREVEIEDIIAKGKRDDNGDEDKDEEGGVEEESKGDEEEELLKNYRDRDTNEQMKKEFIPRSKFGLRSEFVPKGASNDDDKNGIVDGSNIHRQRTDRGGGIGAETTIIDNRPVNQFRSGLEQSHDIMDHPIFTQESTFDSTQGRVIVCPRHGLALTSGDENGGNQLGSHKAGPLSLGTRDRTSPLLTRDNSTAPKFKSSQNHCHSESVVIHPENTIIIGRTNTDGTAEINSGKLDTQSEDVGFVSPESHWEKEVEFDNAGQFPIQYKRGSSHPMDNSGEVVHRCRTSEDRPEATGGRMCYAFDEHIKQLNAKMCPWCQGQSKMHTFPPSKRRLFVNQSEQRKHKSNPSMVCRETEATENDVVGLRMRDNGLGNTNTNTIIDSCARCNLNRMGADVMSNNAINKRSYDDAGCSEKYENKHISSPFRHHRCHEAKPFHPYCEEHNASQSTHTKQTDSLHYHSQSHENNCHYCHKPFPKATPTHQHAHPPCQKGSSRDTHITSPGTLHTKSKHSARSKHQQQHVLPKGPLQQHCNRRPLPSIHGVRLAVGKHYNILPWYSYQTQTNNRSGIITSIEYNEDSTLSPANVCHSTDESISSDINTDRHEYYIDLHELVFDYCPFTRTSSSSDILIDQTPITLHGRTDSILCEQKDSSSSLSFQNQTSVFKTRPNFDKNIHGWQSDLDFNRSISNIPLIEEYSVISQCQKTVLFFKNERASCVCKNHLVFDPPVCSMFYKDRERVLSLGFLDECTFPATISSFRNICVDHIKTSRFSLCCNEADLRVSQIFQGARPNYVSGRRMRDVRHQDILVPLWCVTWSDNWQTAITSFNALDKTNLPWDEHSGMCNVKISPFRNFLSWKSCQQNSSPIVASTTLDVFLLECDTTILHTLDNMCSFGEEMNVNKNTQWLCLSKVLNTINRSSSPAEGNHCSSTAGEENSLDKIDKLWQLSNVDNSSDLEKSREMMIGDNGEQLISQRDCDGSIVGSDRIYKSFMRGQQVENDDESNNQENAILRSGEILITEMLGAESNTLVKNDYTNNELNWCAIGPVISTNSPGKKKEIVTDVGRSTHMEAHVNFDMNKSVIVNSPDQNSCSGNPFKTIPVDIEVTSDSKNSSIDMNYISPMITASADQTDDSQQWPPSHAQTQPNEISSSKSNALLSLPTHSQEHTQISIDVEDTSENEHEVLNVNKQKKRSNSWAPYTSNIQLPLLDKIHSSLVGCLPSITIGTCAADKGSLPNIFAPRAPFQPGEDTCQIFARSVVGAFFSSGRSSCASDPCLQLNDDDDLNEIKVTTPSTEEMLDAVKKSDEYLQQASLGDNLKVENLELGAFPQRRHSSFQTYCKTIGRFGRLARRANGRITHSWYSLDDLQDNCPSKIPSRSATKLAYLTTLGSQIQEAFSLKNLRRVFSTNLFKAVARNGNHGPGSKKMGQGQDTMICNHIDVIITRCESIVMDNSHVALEQTNNYVGTYDLHHSTDDNPSEIHTSNESSATNNSAHVNQMKNSHSYMSGVDTPASSLSRSDDQSLMSRSHDTSIERLRGVSLDLLSPMSASVRGSVCSGLSSVSKVTECSAYTENSRSDCEKITRRSAEREHNITKLLGVITLIFVVSWSVSWSINLMNLTVAIKDTPSNHVIVSLGENLFLMNHFCNIFLYTLFSKSFREKLAQFYTDRSTQFSQQCTRRD